MTRAVRHFSLHRITGTGLDFNNIGIEHRGTELRVVADIEAGVLPVIQAEEVVIREYVRQPRWPHM
jgi:hypothetical protein